MKTILYLITLVLLISCNRSPQQSTTKMIEQTELTNTKIQEYVLLDCMYQDSYFPRFLVDKCKYILLELCQEIESKKPTNVEELYKLTHLSTDKLNDLEDEFFANGSEIETGARECLAENFEFIAKTYGFEEADVEELIGTRNW